jgi:hypothetical protein
MRARSQVIEGGFEEIDVRPNKTGKDRERVVERATAKIVVRLTLLTQVGGENFR